MRQDLELLQGAIELHTHSAPDLFPRLYDHAELARACRDYGLRAVVLKSQNQGSADRVTFVRQLVDGIDIFGGIVLNYSVGALNPWAVDAAIGFGAKVVWMPTADAHHHIQYFRTGGAGVNPLPKATNLPRFKQQAEGIRILDDGGQLRPEVHDILDLVSAAGIALSAGHLSVPETDALITAARQAGIRRLFVDHPNLTFTRVPMEMQEKWAEQGAFMVYCFAEFSPKFYSLSVAEMAANIRRLGAGHVIMASDTGQIANPPPPECLRLFVQLLLEQGIKPEEIHTMLHEHPAQLLYD